MTTKDQERQAIEKIRSLICNKSRNRASALSEHDGNVFTDDGKPKDIIGAS